MLPLVLLLLCSVSSCLCFLLLPSSSASGSAFSHLCFLPLCDLCPWEWLASELVDCFCNCSEDEVVDDDSCLAPPPSGLGDTLLSFSVALVSGVGTLSCSSKVSLVLRFLIGRAVCWTTGLVEDSLAALRLASAAKMAAVA